jgi:hypothetical protein
MGAGQISRGGKNGVESKAEIVAQNKERSLVALLARDDNERKKQKRKQKRLRTAAKLGNKVTQLHRS